MSRAQRRKRLEALEAASSSHSALVRYLQADPLFLMRHLGMEPDPWQAHLLTEQPDRALLLCTRQAGKSTTTAALALHRVLTRPGALVLLLAPALRQSQELFRKVTECYNALGQPIPAESVTALQLHLVNGSRIVALPGTEHTIRGYSGVDLLIIDEAARVGDSLYYAVRPMLAVSGGQLIGLTTPFGKRGWFHDEWHEGDGWEKVKVTAYDCPRISPEFLEEERRALGDWWFKQEYECQFVETSDQVFSYELVMAAVNHDLAPLFAEEAGWSVT